MEDRFPICFFKWTKKDCDTGRSMVLPTGFYKYMPSNETGRSMVFTICVFNYFQQEF